MRAGQRRGGERVLETEFLTEQVLAEAGVERAAALALVYEDDETNIRAALTARRLNPRLRLVLRLYNRRLGQHIEELLDQAAVLVGEDDEAVRDAATSVLSDADTAAPALAATAVAGTGKVIQAEGLLLRAVERVPPPAGVPAPRGLCTLALLSGRRRRRGPGAAARRRGGTAGRRPVPRDAGAVLGGGGTRRRGTGSEWAVYRLSPPCSPSS